jgi:hypothetical protein
VVTVMNLQFPYKASFELASDTACFLFKDSVTSGVLTSTISLENNVHVLKCKILQKPHRNLLYSEME